MMKIKWITLLVLVAGFGSSASGVTDTITFEGDVNGGNLVYEARIRLADTGEVAGLVGRYQSSDRHYSLLFDNGWLILRRGESKIGGGLYKIEPGRWYRLALELQDGLITARVDGEAVFSVHDYLNGSPRLSSGRFGLYKESDAVEFDEVTHRGAGNYNMEPFPLPDVENSEYRKSVCLNGNWTFKPESMPEATLRVPDFWQGAAGYDNVKRAVYERSFQMPDGFLEHVELEFEAVNEMAEVFLNNELIGVHKGKNLNFRLEAGNCCGRENQLKVVVSELDKYHPHAWWNLGGGGQNNLGISGNVWLRSMPGLYVSDTRITTSFRDKAITLELEIRNTGGIARAFEMANMVTGPGGANALEFLEKPGFILEAGQDTMITIRQDWDDPVCWFPDNPHLYELQTVLVDGGKVLDISKERFGFREIWCSGPYLYLNGIRLNLRGDSMVDHGIRVSNTIYSDVIDLQQEDYYELFEDRDAVERMVDDILALNFNVIRTHMGPAPRLLYDVCDEKGLMIIAETACYGTMLHRTYGLGEGPDGKSLMDNTEQWIRECVDMLENHPSVVMWSASNEAWPGENSDKPRPWDLYELTRILNRFDGTRPVIHHAGVMSDCGYVYHYSTSHNTPAIPENLYDQREIGNTLVGEGEFFWSYDWGRYNGSDDSQGSFNHWSRRIMGQGYLTRGYRYANYGYILPYRVNWAWKWSRSPGWDLHEQREVIRKSMAPVAVFDKVYDDDIFDLRPHDLPGVKENSSMNRTLIIYNDEFSDPTVTVRWKAVIGEREIGSGEFSETIELGTHAERAIEVIVPGGEAGNEMVLVLESVKGGETKYLDDSSYRFRIIE